MTDKLIAELAELRKEREEARDALQEKDKRLLAVTAERNYWQAEAQKWQRIRTPTHGTCCTCQGCGQSHEDCRCSEDELEDALNQARNERDELRAKSAAWLDMMYELGSAMPSFVRVTDWEWRDAEKMWRIWNALVAKLHAEAPLGAESKEAKPQAPTCKTCNDTHKMWLERKEGFVPCTKCLTPCNECRDGAYCAETPCKCSCHKAAEISGKLPAPTKPLPPEMIDD